jgi:hypothetical protein
MDDRLKIYTFSFCLVVLLFGGGFAAGRLTANSTSQMPRISQPKELPTKAVNLEEAISKDSQSPNMTISQPTEVVGSASNEQYMQPYEYRPTFDTSGMAKPVYNEIESFKQSQNIDKIAVNYISKMYIDPRHPEYWSQDVQFSFAKGLRATETITAQFFLNVEQVKYVRIISQGSTTISD